MCNRRPRLIVFDLDYTLWPFWVDGTGPQAGRVRAPFYFKTGKVVDSCGKVVRISDEINEILAYLKSEDYRIAVASGTRQIDGALELIHLFGWEEFIDYKQIYPGSKLKHFQRLQDMSGVEYCDMLFFDDEPRYIREVSTLGVFCVQVPDTINKSMVLQGLKDFSSQHNNSSSPRILP